MREEGYGFYLDIFNNVRALLFLFLLFLSVLKSIDDCVLVKTNH